MSDFGDEFQLTLITRNAEFAAAADRAGIDIVGVDIERHKKTLRQGHLPNARISDHELGDLAHLAPMLRRAVLFARLNPLHDGSAAEIETALGYGAQALMLPFFTTAREVETFVRFVDGRARITLLLETAAAVVRLHEVLAVPGFDEVVVGLNDLHLSTGLGNHFELVASDMMTMIADAVRSRNLSFGFGGVARLDDDRLPVPPDLVLAQHARLRSQAAWISRAFIGADPSALDLPGEVARLRARLTYWAAQPDAALTEQREALRRHLRAMGL